MPIIQASSLSKIYQKGSEEIKALKDIDFVVKKGDFIVINGPSGSGKTTLLNLLSGVDKASQGNVFFAGKSLFDYSDKERTLLRRNKIGLVFQAFELIPVLSARENVEYPLLLQKLSRKERMKRVTEVLKQVGLEDRADHFPRQLSGGQQQRTAIARALVTRPEVVFADEPTGNLDSETGQRIIELMLRLNRDYQVAFIIVTHDLLINQYAKKLLNIRDGILEVKRDVKDCLA